MSLEQTESRRKPNWSTSEVEALTNAFADRHSLLEGRFSLKITRKEKQAAWEEVVELVNSQSKTKRSVEETKKKISDIKVTTKKKERQRISASKGTGGGPPPEGLKQWEIKILETIPTEAVHGLNGVDTPIEEPPKKCDESQTVHNLGPGKESLSRKRGSEENEITPQKRKYMSNSPQSSYQEKLIDIEERKIQLKMDHLNILKERNEIEQQKIVEIKKLTNSIDTLFSAVLLK